MRRRRRECRGLRLGVAGRRLGCDGLFRTSWLGPTRLFLSRLRLSRLGPIGLCLNRLCLNRLCLSRLCLSRATGGCWLRGGGC